MTCAGSLSPFRVSRNSPITPIINRNRFKLSPQSIETYCRGIKAFFGFLKREGFIENNVMAKVKMPKVLDIVIPTFSEKEIEKLLAQPDKSSNEGFRNYYLMLTLVDTGIRLSELAHLRTDDIDYE
jgi:integrase/recombinase XerD